MRSQRGVRSRWHLLGVLSLTFVLLAGAGCVAAPWPPPAAADAPVMVSPSPTATVAPSPTATATPIPPTLTATPQPMATATSVPLPSPTVASVSTPGLPVRLRIPAIGVDAQIEPVGLTKDQAMDVPSRWEDVAWFQLGYRPGEIGNAVIAGHLDTDSGAPAVFWSLNKLQPGDEVIVVGDDGLERRFIVQGAEVYPYDRAPVQRIFGPADRPQLNLITCDGAWDRNQRNYSHRLVVYAVGAP